MKNPQSGWSAPGSELGTSWIQVQCVTTVSPRLVNCFCFTEYYYYHCVKDFAISVLKREISSLIWLTLSKFLICTLILIYFVWSFSVIYFSLVFVFGLFGFEVVVCLKTTRIVVETINVAQWGTMFVPSIPLITNDLFLIPRYSSFPWKFDSRLPLISINGKLQKSQELSWG